MSVYNKCGHKTNNAIVRNKSNLLIFYKYISIKSNFDFTGFAIITTSIGAGNYYHRHSNILYAYLKFAGLYHTNSNC